LVIFRISGKNQNSGRYFDSQRNGLFDGEGNAEVSKALVSLNMLSAPM
jgi:hypothetical protein